MEIENSTSISNDLQQRYSHWKKNTKLLYDYLNTNSNKWPSLTCQFFPDIDKSNDTHRLLLSTFTSSQIPDDESIYISHISTLNHLDWSSLNNFDMDEMEFKPDNRIKFPSKNLITDISITFPEGDCNKARYMPQNPDIIGCASSNGCIYIFDRTKRGSKLSTTTSARFSSGSKAYEAKLAKQRKFVIEDGTKNDEFECLSIAWNPQQEGQLLSCESNGNIHLWDFQKEFSSKNREINNTIWDTNFDDLGCNEVTWMNGHNSIFATCGENNKMAVFDTRKEGIVNSIEQGNHNGGINSCKFNYENAMLLASGDSNGIINLWDIRKLNKPIRNLYHGSSISTIEWSPLMNEMIASGGQEDGLVKLWDISNEEEPIFIHGGHMLGINDLSWDLHDPWLLCSVGSDNSIQIWKPAKHLVETKL